MGQEHNRRSTDNFLSKMSPLIYSIFGIVFTVGGFYWVTQERLKANEVYHSMEGQKLDAIDARVRATENAAASTAASMAEIQKDVRDLRNSLVIIKKPRREE